MIHQDFLSDSRFPLHWQMSLSERRVFISVLEKIRPRLAIEIGTYKGGSLQVISHFSTRVISIDANSDFTAGLSSKFENVDFRIGDSTDILPAVISELNEVELTPDFIFVDGGHDEEQVKRDLDTILTIQPRNDVAILCHDSFNPGCRSGIIGANWEESPYVRKVEIDFVPGVFCESDFDTSHRGEMWGGFALAILSAEPRPQHLEISESRKTIFEATYRYSIHRKKETWIYRTCLALKARWNSVATYLFLRCRPARWVRSNLK